MKNKLIILMSILGLVVLGPSIMVAKASVSSNAETTIDDTAITAKIKALFLKDDLVSTIKIHVTTANKVVVLSGDVSNQAVIDRAVSIAKEVKGVDKVVSNIRLVE